MWELDCEESWAVKNWCFWTVVLDKTLESPLACKEVQPVHSIGDQSWVFIGKTDAEAETPILWPPHEKSWLIGKDPDDGRDCGPEEKGTTEWDGWMASSTRCTWGWVNSWSWWWTGRPEVLRFMGLQRTDTTERQLNWTELKLGISLWSIYPDKSILQKDTYPSKVIARHRNNRTVHHQMNPERLSIYSLYYYSARKQNEICAICSIMDGPGDYHMNQVNQTEKTSITDTIYAAGATAKSLKSCLTLCDPTDGSPPSSPVPGILQARTLEWVAISFSNAWKWKMKVKLLSRVRLFVTPWTAAYQAPPSMGFSRQEYWSGVPLPSGGL